MQLTSTHYTRSNSHQIILIENITIRYRIYLVHDELKDKNFELELSWVCKETEGRHERVPDNLFVEAEKSAKQAMEADSDSDTEDI